MGIALRQEGIRNGACVKTEAKERTKNKDLRNTGKQAAMMEQRKQRVD